MSASAGSDAGDKICRDCRESKPLTDLPPANRSRDGRGTYCRPCYGVRSKASYRKRRAEAGHTVRETVAVSPGHKRCPDCGTIKPFSEFPRNSACADGVAVYCKPCHNARGQAGRTAGARIPYVECRLRGMTIEIAPGYVHGVSAS